MSAFPPTARRAATQDKLIDAAVRVFNTRGIEAATVEQICEEAGFTRGAFYSNFETKDDLCIAFLERHRARITGTAAEAIAESLQRLADPHDTELFVVGARRFLKGLTEDFAALFLIAQLRLYARKSPQVRGVVWAYIEERDSFIAGVFDQAVRDQGMRLTVPPRDLVEYVIGTINYQLVEAHARGEEVDEKRIDKVVGTLLERFIVPAEAA